MQPVGASTTVKIREIYFAVATTREAANLSSAPHDFDVEGWLLLALCYCPITIAQSARYEGDPSVYREQAWASKSHVDSRKV